MLIGNFARRRIYFLLARIAVDFLRREVAGPVAGNQVAAFIEDVRFQQFAALGLTQNVVEADVPGAEFPNFFVQHALAFLEPKSSH
jgi:hypothetical protein